MEHQPIIINRLKYSAAWEPLKCDFCVYRIPKGTGIRFSKDCNVEASFDTYMLLRKCNEEQFVSYAKKQSLEISHIDFKKLDIYTILRLFLNSLQKSQGLGYGEASGRLFYCDEKSIKNGKYYKQLWAQEVNLDKDLNIWLSNVTFTAYSTLDEKQQKDVSKKTPYVINSFNDFCDFNLGQIHLEDFTRNTGTDNPEDEIYYIYQPFTTPATPRDFFSVAAKPDSEQNYLTCRSHLLYQILEIFNQKYEGYLSLSFEQMDNIPEFLNTFAMEDGKRKSKEAYYSNALNLIRTFAAENIFNIMFKNENAELAQKLAGKMKECFSGINIFMNEPLSADYVNMVILHNKDYYEKNKLPDEYLEYSDVELVVQDITVELLQENLDKKNFAPAFLEKIIIECIIKKDIVTDSVSFILKDDVLDFDAEMIRFISYRTYEFKNTDADKGTNKNKDKESKTYFYMMTLYLDILRTEYVIYEDINSIPYEIFDVIMDFLDIEHLRNNELLVVEDDSKVFKIEDTHMFPLPDDDLVMEEILKCKLIGTTPKFRNKENSWFITNLLDLKMFYGQDDYGNDVIYYFTSLMGSNLKSECIPKAPKVRKVTGYQTCELFKRYRMFMEVNFITTNNRFTVYPFQFKYLNEYMRKHEKHLKQEYIGSVSSNVMK